MDTAALSASTTDDTIIIISHQLDPLLACIRPWQYMTRVVKVVLEPTFILETVRECLLSGSRKVNCCFFLTNLARELPIILKKKDTFKGYNDKQNIG